MANSSIIIDLNDPRTEKIAEVLSNKTSKKILSLLCEKELSESELSRELKVPLNTIGYNIKKLKESGLIEPIKGFLWSSKGKRVFRYKISNKKILISPKKLMKGIIPSILISSLIALGIKTFVDSQNKIRNIGFQNSETAILEKTAEMPRIVAPDINQKFQNLIGNIPEIWAWFFIGALISLLIFMLWNYFNERGST